MTRSLITAVLLGVVCLTAAGPVAAQSTAPVPTPASMDLSGARSVCEEKTGTVQVREAMFGTNNDDPASWIDLGRSVELCRFEAQDGSRIFVDTITLASAGPTLASVAYLAKVPMPDYDPSKGNPATAYCAGLGGSSAYGGGAAGGGWVDRTDKVDPVAAMCVFPDGSMIDDWGLAYHGDGSVRGIDLAQQFVYQPTGALPAIFGD